ncbi:hypothetical protein LguiB_016222 [Lonicera macranthoides]
MTIYFSSTWLFFIFLLSPSSQIPLMSYITYNIPPFKYRPKKNTFLGRGSSIALLLVVKRSLVFISVKNIFTFPDIFMDSPRNITGKPCEFSGNF